ncbi:nickel pincer cofactor biosynthesis protein LarB [Methanobrevibacter sp. TMH8]|uniref:nickel pincer cofactor biosynthesis protein LarB n=1 Tax=Methanobrevibacter sp. TMH8 TaxID=2848611 RepID=UPI001CCD8B11|nr:nickel pincer cofactor biosynthesis protein LarB [Methanobrevibacter sp. TMH8]MBZ9570161.1 nickel pincer cofactor biosynthesis protein LarB [Methanobrevibacter sp. TMH8]
MKEILEKLLKGSIDIETCENLLKANTILELDEIAKFDNHREVRTGFPEAILAQGKEYSDLLAIVKGYFNNIDNKGPNNINNNINNNENNSSILITRLTKERYNKLKKDLDDFIKKGFSLDYNDKAKILIISSNSNIDDTNNVSNISKEKIGIITAGTSDISVGEEAKVIVEQGGCEAITSYDIGVAGIHRLFPQIAKMVEVGVCAIIVCAGMEGALPSVVAGLVDVPVIGVPTSVGYGVGGEGKAALYAMLQSCAPGIAVVNIDNGFGAGVFALTIAKSLNK